MEKSRANGDEIMSQIFTQYHLKCPFKDSYKLIRHIRMLHNEGILDKISHEGTEDDDTYVCIMLKSTTTLKKHGLAMHRLAVMGLKPI